MEQVSVTDSEYRNKSLVRRSSRGSFRRNSSSLSRDVGDRVVKSLSLSRDIAEQMLGYVDSSEIAQVGDSGDRVSIDYRDDNNSVENGTKIRSHLSNSVLPVSPDKEETASPLPTDGMLNSAEKNQSLKEHSVNENDYKLPQKLDYLLYLINLAPFGILGVLTRYLLQKLFGPSHLKLTGDDTPIYLDLPSNMLGSFLMGWLGVVFKSDIRYFSEHLAIGLSTGYLGSLTTFSGWNQKMLNLASESHWTYAIAGIILGMFIVNESIRLGVESASGLKKTFSRKFNKNETYFEHVRVNSLKRHVMAAAVTLFFLLVLWSLSGALAGVKLTNNRDGAVLWLGCLFGPPGVWARWYLARLNGQGIGRNGNLKWLPIGTLSANIIAACLMASLSTISKAVNTKRCTLVISGIQLGFLGCLSTVSTFVAEVYAMRESGHSGRAFVYELATIVPSFVVGTLIYSVPVWTKHYSGRNYHVQQKQIQAYPLEICVITIVYLEN